jgi:hypothetical protein
MERSMSSMHSRLSTWPLAARASTGSMLTATGLSPIGLTLPDQVKHARHRYRDPRGIVIGQAVDDAQLVGA